jgi:flagellar FliL protein
MAEEKEEVQEETTEAPPKKGSKMLLIIIIAASVVLGAGGFIGYKLLASKGSEADQQKKEVEKKKEKENAIFALDPFVLNLADNGRYLKVSIQFEISDESMHEFVKSRTPQLRDTIITLVSSKSLNSISSPEGKFQLKDEVLFRANQIMGMEKDLLKNLYFTEFVMQ